MISDASVIDRGRTGSYSIEISQRMEGYIMSHRLYNQSDYRNNINATLVLDHFPTVSSIYIRLLHFDLERSLADACYDYLEISSLNHSQLKICPYDYLSMRNWTKFQIQDDKMEFHFSSDASRSTKGFLIQYQGKFVTNFTVSWIKIALSLMNT